MIVEAHTVGQDDWTTLPDANGHTSSDLSGDQACTGGWSDPADAANVLHPFLTHYQTFDPADGKCSSTGTTGSVERRQWQLQRLAAAAVRPGALRRHAGRALDHLLSDWGFQQFPGVFIDDIVVSTGEGSTSFEDDADPMDGWTVPGAPQDDAGRRGSQSQRLDSPRRPRHQGGRGRRDRRHPLHGLRLGGHHGRLDPQPDHGSRDRLPASLTTPPGGGTSRARPPGEVGGGMVKRP